MSDDLVERLKARIIDAGLDAADAMNEALARIDALTAEVLRWQELFDEKHRLMLEHKSHAEKAEADNARLREALQAIADEASVPVHTWKNGINFKKMCAGWRKIATERIDIARAALSGKADK